jgi:hypothetical protein
MIAEEDIMPIEKEVDKYKRDNLNPLEAWIHQTAIYVSRKKGLDPDKTKKEIMKKIQSGEIQSKDPIVQHYHRSNCEDTELTETPMSQYISDIRDNNDILSPSFTTYVRPEIKTSYVSEYLLFNMKERGKVKSQAFKERMKGNKSYFQQLFFKQVGIKLKSNMVSGLFISKGSVISVPSAHATLTSTTRLATSTANTSSERFIFGKRLYNSPDVVIGDILSTIENVHKDNYYEWDNIINKYGIAIPSVDDTYVMVLRSTRDYWRNDIFEAEILSLIKTLDRIELCAFVYSGDFHNFRELNENIIRELLGNLVIFDTSSTIVPEIRDKIKLLEESTIEHMHHVFYYEVKGKGTDYSKYDEVLLSRIYRSGKRFESTITLYGDLFDVLLLNNNMPPNVYDVTQQVRYTVAASDTDSGLKTLVSWVIWYQGNDNITREGIGIASAMVYLCSKLLAHYLRKISVNMGMPKKHIEDKRIAMKPEFTFLAFSLMSISKHYYAGVNVQEGDVFDEFEIEIKGVSLKNSSTPKPVRDLTRSMIREIITSIESNKKISMDKCLKDVIDMETKIDNSIRKGESDYLRTIVMKDTNDYKLKDPKSNISKHDILWNNTFGKKYGLIASTPYVSVKIPVMLTNGTKVKAWLGTIDDITLRNGIMEWFKRFQIKKVEIMYLPLEYVESYGLPKEIQSIVDSRRVILDLVNMLYLVLESLSFYKKPLLTLTEMHEKEQL